MARDHESPTQTQRVTDSRGARILVWLALAAHLFQVAHFALPHTMTADGHLSCGSHHSVLVDEAGDEARDEDRTAWHSESETSGRDSNCCDPADGSPAEPAEEQPDQERDHEHECPFQLPGLSDGSVARPEPSVTAETRAWLESGKALEAHCIARLQVAPKHGPPARV